MDHEIDTDPRFDLHRDPGRPLPDVIADKIVELVRLEVYRPDRRLHSEAELTRRWQVSRSSLRSALQRLEARGLVEARHGLGWFVRRTPPGERIALPEALAAQRYQISELFEVRMGLEGLAVSLAAVRASKAEIDDIIKLNMAHEAAGDDRDELLGTDEALHGAIARASRNHLLQNIYSGVVSELAEFRRQTYASRGVAVRSAREHGKFIRHIANRDPGAARAAMNTHLQRVYDEIADIDVEPLELAYSPAEDEPEWHTQRG